MTLLADWQIEEHALCGRKINLTTTLIHKESGVKHSYQKQHVGIDQEFEDSGMLVSGLGELELIADFTNTSGHQASKQLELHIHSSLMWSYKRLFSHFSEPSVDAEKGPIRLASGYRKYIEKRHDFLKSILASLPGVKIAPIQFDISDHYSMELSVDIILDKRMILPFVAESRNEIEYRGEIIKVPSYGLSSYGYDIRLSNKFKIADGRKRPGQDAVVDPAKNNSHQFFTDLEADSIDLLPGAFILAVSQEYINVPDNCLVEALGKSSVARDGIYAFVTPLEPGWCFTGDTKVALANGTSLSLKEMAEGAIKGERYFGYTVAKDGNIAIEELKNPRLTRKNAELVEITLDNDEVIRCTPDHRFMLKSGEYVEAAKLKENDSLMPLYRYVDKKGYESVSSPIYNKTRPVYVHKLSDDWNIRNNIYPCEQGHVRHHVDFDPSNNYPTNIVRMTDAQHHHIHETKEGYRAERSTIGKQAWHDYVASFSDNMDFAKIVKERFTRNSREFWDSEKHVETRATWLKKHKEPRPYRLKPFDRRVVQEFLIRYGSIRQAAKKLLTKADTLVRRFPDLIAAARNSGYIPLNHKVTSVKKLDYCEDVYCLTVPETENFALEAGVFVHNCGYVTLEIVNHSPNTVRLYAGQGIMQLLFHSNDEQCRTTYKDRNGKYQGQPKEPVVAKY